MYHVNSTVIIDYLSIKNYKYIVFVHEKTTDQILACIDCILAQFYLH